jgi:hypothetical protein
MDIGDIAKAITNNEDSSLRRDFSYALSQGRIRTKEDAVRDAEYCRDGDKQKNVRESTIKKIINYFNPLNYFKQ